MNIDPLFRPLTVKNMKLPNRIVMAPMTRYFSPGGVPTDEVVEYYRRRAAGGTGLILSEGTAVDRPFAVSDPDIPHFYGKDALAGWKKVIDAVHGAGACMGPQLWHAATLYNTQRGCGYIDRLESPSGLVMTAPDPSGAFTLSWTPGTAGNGSLVVMSEGKPVQHNPVNGLTYNASATFGDTS